MAYFNGNKILHTVISSGGGGGDVDQHYDPTSENAQSGIAVEEAVHPINAVIPSGASDINRLITRTELNVALEPINNVIPAEASGENQLVTQYFLNEGYVSYPFLMPLLPPTTSETNPLVDRNSLSEYATQEWAYDKIMTITETSLPYWIAGFLSDDGTPIYEKLTKLSRLPIMVAASGSTGDSGKTMIAAPKWIGGEGESVIQQPGLSLYYDGNNNCVATLGYANKVIATTDIIDAVKAKIPSEASTTNKLADKAWVDEEIYDQVPLRKHLKATTADGIYNSVDDLPEDIAGGMFAYVRKTDSNGNDYIEQYETYLDDYYRWRSNGFKMYNNQNSGSSTGGNYELIETITLSSAVSAIERSQDTHGQAYNFSKVLVKTEIKAASEKKNIQIFLNGSTSNDGFIREGMGTSTTYGFADIDCSQGLLKVTHTQGASSLDGDAYCRLVTGAYGKEMTAITSIRLVGGVAFPANSVIKIYGVRK